MSNLISADRSDFAAALAFAKRAVERRTTIPVLSQVLIRADGDEAMIHTTDLDRRLMVSFPLTERTRAISVLLPAHPLDQLTRASKDCRSIQITPPADGSVAVRFDGQRVSMQSLDPQDFPLIETDTFTHEFEMPVADLLQALQRTQFAISTEETRYYLNGVFMHERDGKLFFVATDGHRMAVTETELPKGASQLPHMIIPRATVDDVIAVCKMKRAPATVTISTSAKLVQFSRGKVTVLSKLIQGTYPDYQRVIPSGNDKKLTVNRKALLDALKAVACVGAQGVKLDMAEDKLVVSAKDAEKGTAERSIKVGYEGDPLEIGFNRGYLVSMANCLESEEVTIMFGDAGSPTRFTGEDDYGLLIVQMPMRV
jgi:DNA polymerase III subunit beta